LLVQMASVSKHDSDRFLLGPGERWGGSGHINLRGGGEGGKNTCQKVQPKTRVGGYAWKTKKPRGETSGSPNSFSSIEPVGESHTRALVTGSPRS